MTDTPTTIVTTLDKNVLADLSAFLVTFLMLGRRMAGNSSKKLSSCVGKMVFSSTPATMIDTEMPSKYSPNMTNMDFAPKSAPAITL